MDSHCDTFIKGILYGNKQITTESKNADELLKHNIEGFVVVVPFLLKAGTKFFQFWDSTYINFNPRPNQLIVVIFFRGHWERGSGKLPRGLYFLLFLNPETDYAGVFTLYKSIKLRIYNFCAHFGMTVMLQ